MRIVVLNVNDRQPEAFGKCRRIVARMQIAGDCLGFISSNVSMRITASPSARRSEDPPDRRCKGRDRKPVLRKAEGIFQLAADRKHGAAAAFSL